LYGVKIIKQTLLLRIFFGQVGMEILENLIILTNNFLLKQFMLNDYYLCFGKIYTGIDMLFPVLEIRPGRSSIISFPWKTQPIVKCNFFYFHILKIHSLSLLKNYETSVFSSLTTSSSHDYLLLISARSRNLRHGQKKSHTIFTDFQWK